MLGQRQKTRSTTCGVAPRFYFCVQLFIDFSRLTTKSAQIFSIRTSAKETVLIDRQKLIGQCAFLLDQFIYFASFVLWPVVEGPNFCAQAARRKRVERGRTCLPF